MSKTSAFAAMVFMSCLAVMSAAFGQTTFKKEQYNKYSEFAKSGFSEVVTVTGPMKLIFLSGMGSEDGKTGDAHQLGNFLSQLARPGMLFEVDVIAAVPAK